MRMQRSSPTLLYSLLFLLILILLQNVGFVRIAEGGKKKIHIPDELDDVEDDEEDEDWKKWGEKSKNEEFDPPRMDPNMDPVTLQAEMMKRHQGPSFGFVKLRFGVKRSPLAPAKLQLNLKNRKRMTQLENIALDVLHLGNPPSYGIKSQPLVRLVEEVKLTLEKSRASEHGATSNISQSLLEDKVGEIAMKWTKVLKTGSIEANFVAVDLSTLMFTMQRGKDITELVEFVLSDPEAYEVKIGNKKYRRPGDPPLDESNEMEDSEHIADDPSPMEEQDHSKDEL